MKRKRTTAWNKSKKKIKKSDYEVSSNSRVVRSVRTKDNVPAVQKLRYVSYFDVNYSSLGNLDQYVFRANSIFDPDFTGVGGQPMRHDQLAAFYDHYTVLSAKITIVHQGRGATNATRSPMVYGIYLSDTTSIGTPSYRRIIENGTPFRVTNEGCANPATKVTCNYDAKKFFNVKNVVDLRDNLGAQFGSNPQEDAYFIFFVQPVDESTDNGEGTYMVMIDYTVQFNEKDLLVQS